MSKAVIADSGRIFYYRSDTLSQRDINLPISKEMRQITLIQRGEGKFIKDGRECDILPGTVLFLRPSEYESLLLSQNFIQEAASVCFFESVLSEDVIEIFYELSALGSLYLGEGAIPLVTSLFEKYDMGVGMPIRERELYLKHLTMEIIVLLSAAYGENVSVGDEDIGSKVVKYINEDITRDFSLEKLSKMFFVSKYYLCRAFKKRNGVSIHSYITEKRIKYAKELIEGGETASGAAYKVGFGDYSAFYRAYLKIVGKSPSAEREN